MVSIWDGLDLDRLNTNVTYADNAAPSFAELNLLPKAKELSGCVFRDIYGYETKEVRLRAKHESIEYTLEQRNGLAQCQLREQVDDFKDKYDDEKNLMIFYYRGTSMTELLDETTLHLT